MAFSCSSQQSCRFLTVHNNSVFILHLKVTSNTGFNFPSCLKGSGEKKKKNNCKVCSRLGQRQTSLASRLIQGGENDRKQYERTRLVCEKCTVDGGVLEVSPESLPRLDLAAALQAD